MGRLLGDERLAAGSGRSAWPDESGFYCIQIRTWGNVFKFTAWHDVAGWYISIFLTSLILFHLFWLPSRLDVMSLGGPEQFAFRMENQVLQPVLYLITLWVEAYASLGGR
jgi:hypothetical protein